MKPVITGFFDHDENHSIQAQIERTNRYQMTYLSLRVHKDEALRELTERKIKELVLMIRKAKLKVAIIDPMIAVYDVHDEQKHREALEAFQETVELADHLKATHLYLKIPILTDVVKEFELLKERLTPFIQLAQKHKKTIILEPHGNQRIGVYAYLIKKFKKGDFLVLFDPVYLMMNKEPATTAYRLLKNRIGAVRAIDADPNGSPRLLGYGKTGIVTVFKKLLRDDYRGFLLVDHDAFYGDVLVEETEKPGFFKRLFSQDKKRKEHAKADLAQRLFPNEEKRDVSYDDIIDNQIEVIKRVFK
jgi:sugar phosphate isomerase/epimerase